MNARRLNVLIIDDIQLIGKKILERLIILNDKYYDDYIDLNPNYYHYDVKQSFETCVSEIHNIIFRNEIEYLLLDRGFNRIVDETYKHEFPDLNIDNFVYSDMRYNDRITADQLLFELTKRDKLLNKILGIIVYTYDPNNKSRAVVQQEIFNHLPKNFKKENLLVIESNSEIYKSADLVLHHLDYLANYPYIRMHNTKKDLMLYGLFMGEILYNQIRYHYFSKRIRSMEKYKASYLGYYLFAYFLFITINLSSNLLSESIFNTYELSWGLVFAIFGVVIPWAIIWYKPEFFLIEKDN
jgi:hypothetical protein